MDKVRTITRMVSVLSVLGKYPDGIGVIELSEKVDIPASSLHRALRSLLHHGLVWQDPTTRDYSLGLGLLDLSISLLKNSTGRFCQSAYTLLTDLVERTREAAFLAMLTQDAVLHIESAIPAGERRVQIISSEVGRVPLHCGASAKAILAYLPSQPLERLIGRCDFRPYTSNTNPGPVYLLHDLATVRKQGYALCDEEFKIGITAIAVPIFNSQGWPFASLGVCGPSPSLKGETRRKVAGYLQETAKGIASL